MKTAILPFALSLLACGGGPGGTGTLAGATPGSGAGFGGTSGAIATSTPGRGATGTSRGAAGASSSGSAATGTTTASGGFAGSCLVNNSEEAALNGDAVCYDFVGSIYIASDVQADCPTYGPFNSAGTYSSSPCSTAGSLGTCTVGAGTSGEFQMIEFAAGSTPLTAAQAAMNCASIQGTWQ